jgi:hypothetical protein
MGPKEAGASAIKTAMTPQAQAGLAYLEQLRQFELEPGMIDFWGDQADRHHLYAQVAAHSPQLNATLRRHLQACADCFYLENQVCLEIYAAPLVPTLGIDAFCNIRLRPGVIVVDLGRVMAADWLKVVAHEYAHGLVGSVGHSPRFAQVVGHLCLGLGLAIPPASPLSAAQLRSYPPCHATLCPIDFWRRGGVGV